MYTVKTNEDSSVIIIRDTKINQKKKALDVMERVQTYEDACEDIGVEPIEYVQVFKGGLTNKDIRGMLALAQLIIIIKALNEGWVPDLINPNEEKWYVFMKLTGSGLAYYDVDFWFARTNAGARLALKNRKLAEYAGKQFEAIYIEYFSNSI